MQRNIQRGIWKEEDGEGAFVFSIDGPRDLALKWPSILAGKPDFIKAYLLYCEEFERRRDDPGHFAWKGLDPGLLPRIVELAGQAGLRVSTHVESAADFHHAVLAGVDEINHLPGFRPERSNDLSGYGDLARYEIAAKDAKMAAERGIFVVSTVGPVLRGLRSFLSSAEQGGPQAQAASRLRQLLIGNLKLLRQSGVRIALGSDFYRGTSAIEAEELLLAGAFDKLTLLKLWCEDTAATIFPGRRIGRLEEGFEASFLVLEGNPLADFANVKRISLRVKQGNVLTVN